MIGDWMAVFAFLGATAFTLGYGVAAPWWRSPIGRNMFAFSAAHMALFALIVASVFWGLEWAGRPSVRAMIFGVIGSLFWWRGLILLTDQLFARRDAREAVRRDPPGVP